MIVAKHNLTMALFIAAAASAQTALCAAKAEPIFAKYRFDAKSNLYPVGGTAKVEAFVADKHGVLARKGVVDLWVDDGWTNVIWRRTVDLAKEPRIKMEFTRDTPGSLRIYMKGKNIPVRERMDRMIFGVNLIEPFTPCPPDFESYWRGELSRLEREVPIAVEKTPAPKLDTPDHTAYYVSFATFNGGRVYGLLLVPKGEGKFPAMVNVPGAGPGTNTIFPSKQQLVRKGWITLLMNVHGIPLTGTNAEYHARFKKWFDDYVTKAGEPRYQYVGYSVSREAPFYHRTILGMTRAIDWLAKEQYADPSRFVYYGCSQGGGFGLYLTAMWGRFAKSLILCPNKCDMLAYRAGRQPGSSHIMNQRPENIAAAEKNAPYHDNCNFARMIHTPVRMVYGTADDNCQTIGGIAAFNRIASKDKQLRLLSGKGHGWLTAGFENWLFDLRARAVPTGTEWKEPENLSFGREERRAAFSSFDTLENALKILPEFSERTISLDSETAWKFKWSPDPVSRPVGFEKPDYDVSGWESIKVPCSWQAYGANGKGGWGTALYVNQTYPFKRDQPDVMGEPPKDWTSYAARNPVGSYRRDFDVPEKWNGQEIFLKFDAVDSFFYLWVNGEYVGFSKDSRNPAEFNVTKFVKSGKNVVALEVYRYSDGSYLEDQDMFRLSGIARSTWLLAKPKVHIRDFTVKPYPIPDLPGRPSNGDWNLEIHVYYSEAIYYADRRLLLTTKLYDMDGNEVLASEARGSRTYSVTARSPKLWSAEEPNCYKLVLHIENGDYVSCLVGFRTSEIKNGRYYFNNEKIKFRGVNRSESDPMYGHYVPRERQLQDIRLMKEANINHVRNSHYPEDDYWYYLCDIYGIYVLDEANVESHGYYYGEASLSHRKEWEKATVARNLDMVRRNRNHPSVVFWSLGNEAGPGENFQAASAAIKKMDPSRPIQYERDNSVADVDSNQYPGVDWTVWKANDHKAKKPFYISEYAHNMCNAMGNLKDYQDAIESSDVILGAAIWDWVDQGLYKRAMVGTRVPRVRGHAGRVTLPNEPKEPFIIAYGGDFGDKPNDGQFVMNGVILSDRTPEPGYWEVKHVFQPFDIKFSDDGRKVTVKNLNYFRSGEGYKLVTEGFQEELSMPPRGSQTFDLPPSLGPNGEERIGRAVGIALTRDEGILKKGHFVADAEFINTRLLSQRELLSVKGEVKDTSNEKSLVFSATNITVRFCRETGALVSYVKDGNEYLLAPMTVDAFRAPSSNEVGLGGRWAQAGLRELVQKATSISEVATNPDGSKSFTIVADVRGKQKERIVGFGGNNGKPCEIVPLGPVAKHDPHFVVAQKWTVFADGKVACQSEIRSRGRVMELARIGYRFTLDKRLDKVAWAGAGPFENYPDRKSGAMQSFWRRSVAEMVEGYAKPQDMGNREDTYVVAIGSSNTNYHGFGVTSLSGPFSFAAIPYSPTELVKTMHPQELPEATKTELGIYAAVRGLGGASCGPGPLGRDIIRNNKTFKLDFMIGIPTRGSKKFPMLPPAELPQDVRTGEDIFPTVVACTSAEPGEGNADHLVDGDLSTIWHSQYGVTLTKYPHAVTVDLGRVANAKGVTIWQRQNGPNGNVKSFRFEVSQDGKTWREVVKGELKATTAAQTFGFSGDVRFWRFTGLAEHNGREFASLAEIRIEE